MELRPAANNHLYCLATLFGEAGKDDAVHQRNRCAWNRWYGGVLAERERRRFVDEGIDADDLTALSDSESANIVAAFRDRIANPTAHPPSPSDGVDFSGTVFAKSVRFDGYLMLSPNFNSTEFLAKADFNSAIFFGVSTFNWGKFCAEATFSSAVFCDPVHFRSAQFDHFASFNGAIFRGDAYFVSTTFSSVASLDDTKFEHVADFGSATFSDDANFVPVKIFGRARFHSTKFFGKARFSGTFEGTTDFEEVLFSKEASFQSVKFNEIISFKNAKFASSTYFTGAQFKKFVPDFRGATLHEGTEWDGVSWPDPNVSEAKRQVYCYERLKQEMQRLNKHEDELVFFGKEMRAKRETFGRWTPSRLMNWAYGTFSNYGASIRRPLGCLAIVYAIGVPVFFFWGQPHRAPMKIFWAGALSAANVFPFLPKHDDAFRMISKLAILVGAAQSLLGLAFLFLFSLALRNRFRMN